MRELAREWMASFTSFTRGHGGGQRANASVGAAFVIGAIVVAVLGLRWISASGPTEEGADDTPWDVQSEASQTTGTTIPASLPARVVVVRDPGDPPAGETVVTLPDGQTGIFLPGFPPVEGGTTGTTGPGSDGTNPPGTPGTPGTTRPGSNPTTGPPRTTRPSQTAPTTDPPPTTTEPPPTTDPPPTTTDPPPTTGDTIPPIEVLDLGLGLDDGLAAAIDGLGLLIS